MAKEKFRVINIKADVDFPFRVDRKQADNVWRKVDDFRSYDASLKAIDKLTAGGDVLFETDWVEVGAK